MNLTPRTGLTSRACHGSSLLFRRKSAERRPQTAHSPARQKYDWNEVVRSQRHRGHLATFAKDISPTRFEVPKLALKEVVKPMANAIDMDFDLKSRVMRQLEVSSQRDSKFKRLRDEMHLDLSKLEGLKQGSAASSERLRTEVSLTVRGLSSLRDRCTGLKTRMKEMEPKTRVRHPKAKEFFMSVKSQKTELMRVLLIAFPCLALEVDSVRSKKTEKTALHWAALRNDVDLIRILLDFKAEPLAKDIVISTQGGRTALDLAKRYSKKLAYKELLKFLRHRGYTKGRETTSVVMVMKKLVSGAIKRGIETER